MNDPTPIRSAPPDFSGDFDARPTETAHDDTATRLVPGVAAFAEDYDVFLVDQWGVLHDGRNPFPGVVDCLHRLQALGKRVILLSNSGKRASVNTARLAALGILPDSYTALITSGEIARTRLASREEPFPPSLGRRCLLIRGEIEEGLLDGLDVEPVPQINQAEFILLAGVHEALTLEDYQAVLEGAAARGLPMVCINPDLVRFAPSGLTFSSGELARRYELLGGSVRYVGKPHPLIYDYCRAHYPFAPGRAVAVGDSFHHDVAGGVQAGLATAFVMEGIHAAEFAGAQNDADRAACLAALSRETGVSPDWAIPGFRW